MKGQVRINHDYFSLNTKTDNAKYFLRQGNVLAHLIDRTKWRYFPKYFIVPSFPTHLEVEASSACQMCCPMCKTTEMVSKGIDFFGFMDMGLYRKIIDECVREPLYSIKLSWRGEPLLHPHIVEMVSYAKVRGVKDIAFLTNAERLNLKLTEELVRAGLDWISISFDGLAEIYDKIRKPAIFKETVEKIRYIRKYRDRLNRTKPLIRIQSLHSAIKGQEEEFLSFWEGIADKVNFIADQKRSIDQKDYTHDPYYVCPASWQRMCIAWDGRVAQCYSDYMMGNVLGDVKENSIKAIWHGEPFNNLRKLMKCGKRLMAKPCQTCSDGGIVEKEEVMVGDRKIRAVHYVHQGIDVRRLSAKDHDGS